MHIYRDTARYDIAYRFQNSDSLKVKCFISMTVSGKNRRVTVLIAVKHVLDIGSTRYSTHWLSQCWNGFVLMFLNVSCVSWFWRVSLMLNEGWQFYKYGAVEGQMLLQMHWSTWSWQVQWLLLSLDWTRPGGNRFCNFHTTVSTKHRGRRLQGQSPWRSELKGKLAVVHRLPKTLWGLNMQHFSY